MSETSAGSNNVCGYPDCAGTGNKCCGPCSLAAARAIAALPAPGSGMTEGERTYIEKAKNLYRKCRDEGQDPAADKIWGLIAIIDRLSTQPAPPASRVKASELASFIASWYEREAGPDLTSLGAAADLSRAIIDRFTQPVHQTGSTARDAGLEEAAKCIPTNWLDPLLTGDGKIAEPPYDCRDIEKLLQALQKRIRAMKGGGGER